MSVREYLPVKLITVLSLLRGSMKYIFLSLIAVAFLTPFLWTVLTSFKLPHDIVVTKLTLLPDSFTFSNYVRVWTKYSFTRYILNSLIVTGTITICSVMFSSLAAFAFAKYKFPGRILFFFIILSILMIPEEISAIPLYILISKLGWVDTYPALIVPWLVSAYGVFLMMQFIRAVPNELLDAARIDGCSEFRLWWCIVLPASKSGLAVVALYIFIFTWNQFLWPLLVINSEAMRTVQLGVAFQIDQYDTRYGPLMASTIIAIIPTTVVFLFLRRQIMENITLSGLKA